MGTQSRPTSSRNGGVSDFFWNLVGGAMVSAMLAGVMYVLVGMLASFLNNNDSYWELIYLKWYFIIVMIVYVVMPSLLANAVGFIFGSKSKASGNGNKVKVR